MRIKNASLFAEGGQEELSKDIYREVIIWVQNRKDSI